MVADASALQAIEGDFGEYLLHPQAAAIAHALGSWRWLNPPATEPVLVTAFGDMFFVTPSEVVMLSTVTGQLEVPAANLSEFTARLTDADEQDWYLHAGWVQTARRHGLILAPDECYDWIRPPALGGQRQIENIGTINFDVKLHVLGQIYRQIKDLPPGAKIGKLTITD